MHRFYYIVKFTNALGETRYRFNTERGKSLRCWAKKQSAKNAAERDGYREHRCGMPPVQWR